MATKRIYPLINCVLCGRPLTTMQAKRYRKSVRQTGRTTGPFCSVRCSARGGAHPMSGNLIRNVFVRFKDLKIEFELLKEQNERLRGQLLTTGGIYVIWSNEHNAWWGPARRGYTNVLARAGNYTYQEALKIVQDANCACEPGETHEVMFKLI